MKRKFILTTMILSLFIMMGAGHLRARTVAEVSTFTELKTALENDGKIEFADNITTTNDEEPNENVAQIVEDGNVQNFSTIQEAIDAAKLGQTITLLDNVEINSRFELNKNLIFDLNGKSITSVGENVDIFRVKGTEIKIYNGTLNATKGVAVFSEGTGGENANKIVVENVVINSNCWGIYHDVTNFGANVTITNSTITDSHEKGAGIFLSGLYYEWDGNVNNLSITNSTIKGATAVEVKQSKITVNNSTLEATSETQNVENSYGGSCTVGYALALTNYTENAEYPKPTKGSIDLVGENILKGGIVIKAEADVYVTSESPKLIPAPEGYYWNGGDLEMINNIYVEAVIGKTYYSTLQEAIDAATAGQTITLLDNVSIYSRFELMDKNLIFDLNGKSITSVGENVDIFRVKGTEIEIYNGILNAAGVAVFSIGNGSKANEIVVENVVINSNCWGIHHDVTSFGANVTITNSTITDSHERGAGIFLSGSRNWNAKEGEKLNKLSIVNSTIKGATAVEVKYGNISVNNSTLEATSKTQSFENNDNGSCAIGGYALALTNNTKDGSNYTPTVGSIILEGENTLEGGVLIKAEADVSVTTNSPKLIPAPEGYYWNGDDLEIINDIHAEAVIGKTYYPTLEEAVAEAPDDQTITLLDNVEIENRFELNKNLIFDLNGKKIESVGENVDIFKVNGTDITIYNGTLNAKRVAVFSEGNNNTETANQIVVENVVINSNYWGIYHNGNKFGANVTITNSTISDTDEDGAGIFLSGSEKWNNAEDGEKLNKLSITKSTIKGATAVEVKYGNITVNNSTLEATSETQSFADNNNGACAIGGYALALTNNTKDGNITSTVGSINLEGENTLKGGVLIKAEDEVSVTTNSPTSILAPEGYYWNEGTLIKIDVPNAEAVIGGEFYSTLEEAVEKADAGQTIALLKDVEIEVQAGLLINKNLTVDLSSYQITNICSDGEGDVFRVESNDAATTFTVMNGTLNSEDIAIYSAGNGNYVNTVIVQNVEINSDYWGIYHNGNKFGADVTVTNSIITDSYGNGAGIFLSGSEAWNNAKNETKLNNLSITNSTIKGATAVEVKYGNITVNNSTLEATSETQNVAYNNNGSCAIGYALALTNNTKDGNIASTVGSINLVGENTLKGGVLIKVDGEVSVTTNSPELIPAPEGYYWNEDALTKIENPNAEAVIGTTYYTTLEEAVAEATAGQTITLLKDVEIEQALNITCDLTFLGNNKTLTYNGSDRAITVEKETNGANLTISDLKIEFTKNYCQRGINYNTTGKLTLNNVTINKGAKNVTYAINLPGDSDNAVVNINDSNIKGNIALNIWGENTKIDAVNTNFTSIDRNADENYAAIMFNNNGVISADGSSINTTGGSIIANDQEGKPSIAIMLSAADINCSNIGTTMVGDVKPSKAVVYYNGTDNVYVCMTFKEAIDKAIQTNAAGVRLIRNDAGPGIVIDKSLTIDFKGFTYTFTDKGVGSGDVTSQGFQILQGNNNTVVLKNGTLNVAESAKGEYFMLIQNYANLTVEDMTLDATNADKYSIRDGDSYALSNNCGTVNITGNTTIIANDEGELNYAFDSYKFGNYEAPVVTVNTTGEIRGVVEVSAVLNLEAVGTNNISNLIIKGEGQLYNDVEGIHGTIVKTFENDGDGNAENDWYTLATPFEHSVDKLQTTSSYALYRYNEESALWENVKVGENNFNTLDLGRGYIYANAETTEVEFEGTLNVKPVTYQLTASSETNLKGFNLVGNPFTQEIAMENLTTTGAVLADGFYVLENDGAWVPKTNSDKIAAYQAALIKTTEAAELTIVRNVSSKSRAVNNGQLMINVANSKYNDVAYVSFNEGVGLDKIAHRNAEIPMVYVPVNGTDYAVATMNKEVTEIPVSFVANSLGQYTFSVEAQDCEFSTMYLYDRLTGETTNLLLEDYTFMAKSGDNAERFIIKLASDDDNAANIDNFAFISNGELIINNIDGEGVVRIVDVLGRPVAEYNVFGSANISTTTIRSGVYMIQMIDGNGTKVQKIIID